VTVTPADLGTYLGATVDTDRGQYLSDRAPDLCLSIVTPLPSGADAVVLDVAVRAYSNPSNTTAQAAGPYSATFGPVGGGLWLTRENKATLRRLAGSGGAFTIDTMPTTAGTGLPWWDQSGWGFSDMLPGTWDSPT
jgi:hypothetical protein